MRLGLDTFARCAKGGAKGGSMAWSGYDDPKTEVELIHNLHVKVNRLQSEVRWLLIMVAALLGIAVRDGGPSDQKPPASRASAEGLASATPYWFGG